MTAEEIYEILLHGESQTVEFKASLATKKEAIQTMVAFANAQGGRVFLGVENDGTAKGVHIGNKTPEDLANKISMHTYPSLPAYIEQVDVNGKHVLVAEVAEDMPPVIGVYLYSSDPITPDKPVDARNLQAFRRVGRTNQKEDFMRLRTPLPSDPKLRVVLGGGWIGWGGQTSGSFFPSKFSGYVWAEEGSATAHNVTFRLDPPMCECSASAIDLPYYPYEHPRARASGFKMQASFEFVCTNVPESTPSTVRLIATYKDDQGFTWESARRLDLVIDPGSKLASLADGGDFSRRIIKFPPKVTL